jgi:hypothetical protein
MSEIFLDLIHDPIGRWFIYIGAFIVLATMGYFAGKAIFEKLNEVLDNVKVVKDQVANDHSTNLRDEQDERHTDNSGKLDLLVSMVKGQGQSISSLQETQGQMYDLISRANDDIENISNTLTPEQRKRLSKGNNV